MRRKWCDIMKFVGEVVKVGNFPLPDALWHKITRCATGPLVLLVQTTTWMNNDIFDSIASFIKSAVERKALVPSFGTVVGENKSVVEYLRLVHTDSLKNKITLLVDAVDRRWSNWSVTSEGDYIRALEGYKLKSSTTLTSTHAFKNNSTVTSPAVTKRMQHEIRDLTRHLPIHPESSIYVVYDDKRSDLLKAMITGPVGTPYANGCFVFDIHVSSTYPNAPPKVKFMTTGGGKIRFNPNLYANGKVCLSLLGTWRGPGWKAKESNIRQVLLSIQGLVLVPHPYFNEPGFEGSMNTSQGSRASETYNQSIRSHCLRTAILNMMRKPPVGLEEVVRLHFQYRADQILYQLEEWEASADAGHKPAVSKTSSELRPLLEAARRQRVDIPPEVIDLDDD
ncbi:ubiquitin-conjugating enzyme E2 Ze [Perkinsus chesapeaki]|uniref:Ubiquitin-conjugating enzyme E2 Ze n=1 Tax=Perkinsus chesapeaki TaxID=330153 RepID=A0A7J6LLV1_PERCH|nr:ubiquitin-conjugating enzyme E2 Ze [Perkinsus chesapeaki]